MILEIATPALLFPAISLLFLAFTNRFLALAALIRTLHKDWLGSQQEILQTQIQNLSQRLTLIRTMQMFGAGSLLLCLASMTSILTGIEKFAPGTFLAAVIFMAASITCLLYEIWISGGALRILLNSVESQSQSEKKP